MDKREIQTLMRRLFYGDIDQSDGWQHLIRDGELSQELFEVLLNHYVSSESVLVYQNSQQAVHCLKAEAFVHVAEFLKSGPVRIADPRFQSKILINPIGVGVGSRL